MSLDSGEDRIFEEAVRWWQELRSDEFCDDALFSEWLEADSRHKEAFQSISMGWDLIEDVQSAPEMLAYRAEALSQAQKLGAQRWRAPRGIDRRALAAGLGAALALPIAGLWFVNRTQAQDFVTKTGEQKTRRLADGSIIYLDANSALRVEYSHRRRDVKLHSGRALFQVAKESRRPFTVEANGTSVTATGTSFMVEYRHDAMSIVLAEGTVLVSGHGIHQDLQPGENLILQPGRLPQLTSTLDISKTLSWREGQIVFENTSLLDAVDRMNDYATTQIVVDDAKLAGLRISGVFTAGKSLAFVHAITAYLPVASHMSGTRVILSMRAEK